MMLSKFLVSFVLLMIVCNAKTLKRDFATVTPAIGPIQGIVQEEIIDGQLKVMSKFTGIPYGESTAGNNRFRKPIPKASFTSTYNATYPRDACSQSPIAGRSYTYSEDCLFLNVFVPGNVSAMSAADLPVMIWIHGGAFVSGASYSYPMDVISSYGDVVVVTINYRLGKFGFLTTADGRLKGNYGLWDQQLAIQWVNKHIGAFGGNKDEVTLFGESAGSVSVFLQALYPGNVGMLKRIIGGSGTATAYWSISTSSNADSVILNSGCTTSVNQIDCLRSKSEQDIRGIVNLASEYRPTIDGEFLKETPYDILMKRNPVSNSARALFSSLDILTGVNNMDGALYLLIVWAPFLRTTVLNNLHVTHSQMSDSLIPYGVESIFKSENAVTKATISKALNFMYTNWSDPENLVNVRNNLVKFSSDVAFFTPLLDTVNAHARLRGATRKTYMYVFTTQPIKHRIPTPSWISGANHADDVQFVTGEVVTRNQSVAEMTLSKSIITMWTDFAKSGDPNKPIDVTSLVNTTWPVYDTTTQKYLELSTHMSSASVKTRFAADSVAFWTKLIPAIINGSCHVTSPSSTVKPSVDLIG